MREKIEKVIKSLEKNNIEVIIAEKKEDVAGIVAGLLKKGETVSCGGSVSLAESGVMELLRSGDYNFLDRAAEGVDVGALYRETFSADTFLTSANALTEKGELINVDGNGNRVAATVFGPKRVIYIIGVNKLVADMREGFRRIKTVASPKNAVRLGVNTPCRTLGHCICVDGDITDGCLADGRMCAYYNISAFQRNKDRVKVVLCKDELGY